MTVWHLHRTVTLVGMMGAGKTAVGTQVARILGVPFVDSDTEITTAANMTIPEIFARDGEAFFRARETEVIGRLLAGAPSILSTGGGAYLSAENRAMIAARGVALWLRADLDLLWERVRHKDTRPLLRTPDPRATLSDLLTARTPAYRQAELAVDADRAFSVADMAARVIDMLSSRPEILSRRRK